MDFLILIFFLQAGFCLIRRQMLRHRQTRAHRECVKILHGKGRDGSLQDGHLADLNIILEVQLDILSQVDVPQHGVPGVPCGGRLVWEGRGYDVPRRCCPLSGSFGVSSGLILVVRPGLVELVLGVSEEVRGVGNVLYLLKKRKFW